MSSLLGNNSPCSSVRCQDKSLNVVSSKGGQERVEPLWHVLYSDLKPRRPLQQREKKQTQQWMGDSHRWKTWWCAQLANRQMWQLIMPTFVARQWSRIIAEILRSCKVSNERKQNRSETHLAVLVVGARPLRPEFQTVFFECEPSAWTKLGSRYLNWTGSTRSLQFTKN